MVKFDAVLTIGDLIRAPAFDGSGINSAVLMPAGAHKQDGPQLRGTEWVISMLVGHCAAG